MNLRAKTRFYSLILKFLISSTLFLCSCNNFFVFGKNPYIPSSKEIPYTGITSHPRLLLNYENIETIKSNLTASENAGALKLYKDLDNYSFDQDLEFSEVPGKSFRFDGETLSKIELAAFKYVMTNNAKYMNWAYSSFLSCCDSLDIETGIFDKCRVYGQLIFTAAELYDWGYDILSEEEKDELYDLVRDQFFPKMEIGFPPTKQNSITGHGCEAQLLKNLLGFSIAVYDEHPEIWEECAKRLFSDFFPSRQFFYNSGIPNFQGPTYSPYRSSFDAWSIILLKACKLTEETGLEDAVNSYGENFIFSYFRPDDQPWRIGDTTGETAKSFNPSHYKVYAFLLANITKNPRLKYYAKEKLNNFKSFKYNKDGETDDDLTPAIFLILNRPEIESKDYKTDTYNITYINYPMGEYFATHKDGLGLHLRIGEINEGNHHHPDSGTFEIFYKEILASASGTYESGSNYNSSHMRNYYQTSFSHNTIALRNYVYASGELNNKISVYKSQRTVNAPSYLYYLQNNRQYNYAKVLNHEDYLDAEQKAHIILEGDISKSYAGNNTIIRKMHGILDANSNYPVILAVYDSGILTNATDAISFCHVQNQAVKNGNIISANSKKSISKLINIPLICKNEETNIVGGPNQEYYINGINYKPKRVFTDDSINEAGWGRIETCGINSGNNYELLNLYIACNATETTLPKVELLETKSSHVISVDGLKIEFQKQ